MILVAMFQEAAAATMTADPVTIQAVAAVLLPAAVQILKMLIPTLEGKALLYGNLALNSMVAIGLIVGAGAAPVETLALGLGAGLAGSKVVDLKKRGAVLSSRHRK